MCNHLKIKYASIGFVCQIRLLGIIPKTLIVKTDSINPISILSDRLTKKKNERSELTRRDLLAQASENRAQGQNIISPVSGSYTTKSSSFSPSCTANAEPVFSLSDTAVSLLDEVSQDGSDELSVCLAVEFGTVVR